MGKLWELIYDANSINNSMKKIILSVMAAAMFFGCNAQQGEKALVAYFSATGTTEEVAQKIAQATGATLFEIRPTEAYTADDLNWNDKQSRSSVEMADPNSRPAIVADLSDAASFDKIYIGFPIWWDLAPREINTFLDTYGFKGKTVVPFATSGGSSISNSVKALRAAYPEIAWKSGKLMNRASDKSIGELVNQ